jgi:hypothetical protein
MGKTGELRSEKNVKKTVAIRAVSIVVCAITDVVCAVYAKSAKSTKKGVAEPITLCVKFIAICAVCKFSIFQGKLKRESVQRVH